MLHSAKYPLLSETLVAVLVLFAAASAQALPRADLDRTVRGFELRPGVWVDPDRSRVYASHPDGALEALDLTDGRVLWRTTEAAKPLLLVGELLIAQVDTLPGDATLRLVTLDATLGSALFSSSLQLPDDVRPSIDDGLGQAFVTHTLLWQEKIVVSWTDSSHSISALPDAQTTSDARELSGAAVLDPSTETLESFTGESFTGESFTGEGFPEMAARRPDLPLELRLADLPAVQFLAADGKHAMVSERIADDRVAAKYEWTVYAYPSGQVRGKAANRSSYSPFCVVGSRLLFESRPTILRQAGNLDDEPLSLRVVELARGQELWRHPIRDTTYRGPLPP